MIIYSGMFGYAKCSGSTAPKALFWAIPSAFSVWAWRQAIFLSDMYDLDEERTPSAAESAGYGMFMTVFSFLLVFRAQLAYGRYWEGITLVERACGVWLNGVSNLIAFCSASSEKQVEVAAFQHLLSRLMSLLLTVSLCDITLLAEEAFPTLSIDGIDPSSLEYLSSSHSQQKVVLQWIQRLVVENARTGVIDIAPPILSRVFQEFSQGIVKFIDAKKITNVPFPFQFAQAVWIMLIFFCFAFVPLACALYMSEIKGCICCFILAMVFSLVHLTSIELEQPFGDGANDLPLEDINEEFKQALQTLLEPEAQQTPCLVKTTSEMIDHVNICKRIARERNTSISGSSIVSNIPSFSNKGGSLGGLVESSRSWRIKLFSRRSEVKEFGGVDRRALEGRGDVLEEIIAEDPYVSEPSVVTSKDDPSSPQPVLNRHKQRKGSAVRPHQQLPAQLPQDWSCSRRSNNETPSRGSTEGSPKSDRKMGRINERKPLENSEVHFADLRSMHNPRHQTRSLSPPRALATPAQPRSMGNIGILRPQRRPDEQDLAATAPGPPRQKQTLAATTSCVDSGRRSHQVEQPTRPRLVADRSAVASPTPPGNLRTGTHLGAPPPATAAAATAAAAAQGAPLGAAAALAALDAQLQASPLPSPRRLFEAPPPLLSSAPAPYQSAAPRTTTQGAEGITPNENNLELALNVHTEGHHPERE